MHVYCFEEGEYSDKGWSFWQHERQMTAPEVAELLRETAKRDELAELKISGYTKIAEIVLKLAGFVETQITTLWLADAWRVTSGDARKEALSMIENGWWEGKETRKPGHNEP